MSRRTFSIRIRAKNATVFFFGPYHARTILALINNLAGIYEHFLFFLMLAMGASYDSIGFNLNIHTFVFILSIYYIIIRFKLKIGQLKNYNLIGKPN